MKRREFIATLGSMAIARPTGLGAQPRVSIDHTAHSISAISRLGSFCVDLLVESRQLESTVCGSDRMSGLRQKRRFPPSRA